MNIDGNKIAKEIIEDGRKRIETLGRIPKLAVIAAGTELITENFLAVKERKAKEAGIEVSIRRFPEDVSTEELVNAIESAEEDGIIVQLPLPSGVDREAALDAIPTEKDADVLSRGSKKAFESGDLSILPPVVGAIAEVISRHDISLKNKETVIVGKGVLVGAPAAVWFARQGACVHVIDHNTKDVRTCTQKADIIVSGAGKPGIITPDMIKEGVVLLDAGTSEAEGELKGDADPACASKCSIFTPVPGGIGPVTVAVLLSNIVTLASVVASD